MTVDERVKLDFLETISHEVGHAIAAKSAGCSFARIRLFPNPSLDKPGFNGFAERCILGQHAHPAPALDIDTAFIGYAGVLAEYLLTGQLEEKSDNEIFAMTARQGAMSASDIEAVSAVGFNGKREAFDRALLFIRLHASAIEKYTMTLKAMFLDGGAQDSTYIIPGLDYSPPVSNLFL
jgi:hypothetical protein